MSLNIELKDAKVSYRPGEDVEGEACWALDPAPPELVVRLCWRSEAPGHFTSDPVTAVEQRIESPAAGHAHSPFRLKAPEAPWSFQGEHFSIRWCVRLETLSGHYVETELSIR